MLRVGKKIGGVSADEVRALAVEVDPDLDPSEATALAGREACQSEN